MTTMNTMHENGAYAEKSTSVSSNSQNNNNYTTLDERRRNALAEIDSAPFGWFHVKAIMVAGVGFFTDSYDIFAINLASQMIGYVYNWDILQNPGSARYKLTANQDLGLKVATPVGTFMGQLLFGWLADRYGRKRLYGIELILIIIATIAQALSGQGPGVTIIGVLIFWRFIMGLGIGGDYPLSACITSEFATTKWRGAMMGAVFAMQGFGILAGALVATVVLAAFKSSIINEGLTIVAQGTVASPQYVPMKIDYCWRLLIGLGAVPAGLALYFRLTIPETPRYTMDVERNVKQAVADIDTVVNSTPNSVDPDAPIERSPIRKGTWKDFTHFFGQWKNGKVLLGTAVSWFVLDVAYYGLGLNNAIVLTAIGFGSSTTGTPQYAAWRTLFNAAIGNIILAVAGTIPGYWVSVLFLDVWGRKPIQFLGFIMEFILFVIIGFAYQPLKNNAIGAFIFLFVLIQFFNNFGANMTTFIVPGECFPTRYRSTGHGISAASGKLGAIVAQVGFARLKDIGGAAGSNAFLGHIFEIFALFMLIGIFATFLIPETKRRTLEELSNEDQEGFVQA